MKRLRTILQYRYTFKYITLVIILIVLFISLLFPKSSKYSEDVVSINGRIISKNIDGNKLTLIVKGKEKVIVNYYFLKEQEKNEFVVKYDLGDIVVVNGEMNVPSKNTIFNGFNYKNYLKYKNIYFIMDASSINIEKKNDNVFYYIKSKIIKRLDNIDGSGYLKLFLLGDKTLIDNDILSIYQSNGISHLFAVSGMHISILIGILFIILDKLTYNNFIKYLYALIFLLFYLFLTDYSSSILRASIMFLVSGVSKCSNIKISKIDISLITLDVILIINPYFVLQIGFQYSYVVSFSIAVFNNKIKRISNKFVKSLYLSYLCFMVTLPISIYYFNQVNFISIIINIIYIPFVSFIVFPLCLLSFVFGFMVNILNVFTFILEFSNRLVNNIDLFKVVFAKTSILLILMYYIFIYLSILNKKNIFILLSILVLHKNIEYFNSEMVVTMLDVGQGDCIFIKMPYNSGNILIDTGGIVSYNDGEWKKRNKEYSIANNKIIPYLKSMGIDKIDALIVSHGDYDHMGESINLVKNYKIKKVIFNCGIYNDLEKELIDVLVRDNIEYYSCIERLDINDYSFYFLNTKIYDDENNNSSVIYFNYNNYKFLFMGDAGIEKEGDILDRYNINNVDVLKVGHHGSKTSSSKSFIDEISPKYGVISVGKNNRYGHPNKEVLNNLKNTEVYRTDLDGSIMFKIENNKLNIKTCSP